MPPPPTTTIKPAHTSGSPCPKDLLSCKCCGTWGTPLSAHVSQQHLQDYKMHVQKTVSRARNARSDKCPRECQFQCAHAGANAAPLRVVTRRRLLRLLKHSICLRRAGISLLSPFSPSQISFGISTFVPCHSLPKLPFCQQKGIFCLESDFSYFSRYHVTIE